MAFKVKNPENFSPGIRHLSEEESKEIDKLIEAQPISLPEPRQDEWIAHTSNADMIQAPEIPDGIPELGVWGGTIIGALYLLGRVFGFLRSVGITLPQDRKRPDGPRRVVFGKGHSVTCGKCQNEVKV